MLPIEQIQHTIQLVLAPVLLISANGLICLALYNRLSNVVTRGRAFHKEWFDRSGELAETRAREPDSPDARYLAQRIEIIDLMGHGAILRARLVRNALIFLLSAVVCLLACSIALGLALVLSWMGLVALVMFYVGVALMIVGVLLALLELHKGLDPLKMEHRMIDEIAHDDEASP